MMYMASVFLFALLLWKWYAILIPPDPKAAK